MKSSCSSPGLGIPGIDMGASYLGQFCPGNPLESPGLGIPGSDMGAKEKILCPQLVALPKPPAGQEEMGGEKNEKCGKNETEVLEGFKRIWDEAEGASLSPQSLLSMMNVTAAILDDLKVDAEEAAAAADDDPALEVP
eukprot:8712380-Karenia_brevis.AAC.1